MCIRDSSYTIRRVCKKQATGWQLDLPTIPVVNRDRAILIVRLHLRAVRLCGFVCLGWCHLGAGRGFESVGCHSAMFPLVKPVAFTEFESVEFPVVAVVKTVLQPCSHTPHIPNPNILAIKPSHSRHNPN